MRSARQVSVFGASAKERLKRRAKEDAAVKASGAVVGAGGSAAMATLAAVGVSFPPWSTIVAAGAAVTLATTMAVIGAVRRRESKLIAGDKSAIRAFVKHSARWGAAKRKRVATRLLKQYQAHKAKGKKRAGFLGLGKKQKREKDAWRAREAALRLKLEVLTGLEIEARKDRKNPLVKGDMLTVPEVNDASRKANASDASEASALFDDSSLVWWAVGGAVVVISAAVYANSQRPPRGQ